MYAARAQWETGYLKQAMQSYRTFLDHGAKDATNLATYGRLCLAALAYDEASRALDEAEQLDPECGHMLSAKGTLAMFRGRFEDALAYARKATQFDPRDTAALKLLVQVSGGRVTEDERAQLRRLSENPELRPEVRIPATFALADCLDAEGDADAAFAAYERANQLGAERARRERLDYDRAERTRQTDRLISTFRTAPRPAKSNSRPTPIFVVGMPDRERR
jgi:tetratricopeptide (TPR) repeat protein